MLGKIAVCLLAINVIYVTYKCIVAYTTYVKLEVFETGEWKLYGTYDAVSDAFDALDKLRSQKECVRIRRITKSKFKKEHENLSKGISK